MENYIIFLFGVLISCSIYTIILFQFIEERYHRIYDNKRLYWILQAGTCVIMMAVNILNIPVINLAGWVIVIGIITIRFYVSYEKNIWQRLLEIVVLLLVLAACETVGYLLFEFIIWKLQITNIQPMIYECLHMTFSKLVILISYYFIIVKIWKGSGQNKFTAPQYIIYGILMVYSVINLSVIIIVVANEMQTSFAERLLLLVNMFCIVFADFLILYVTKYTEENGKLKMKLGLLEQQAFLQHEYYSEQTNRYNESVKILHDINKHLRMIDRLHTEEYKGEAEEYTKEIKGMLISLLPQEYTNNPILNVILNDKKRSAQAIGVLFDLEVGQADVNFMSSIEITTVFANLLDNAIEACRTATGKRYIKMKLDTYNDFIVIHITNSMNNKLTWQNGKPLSQKGRNHGIGLINVENIVKKYNGDMILKEEEGEFICNIILNG